MTAPSPKEALEAAMRAFKACRPIERVACQDFGMQQDDILEQQLEAALSAALATLQPSGDRRDAIARRLKSRIGSGRTVTVGPGLYEDISEAADAILASGLVQDEAAIRADEREKCAEIADLRYEPVATEIAAAIRSARDGGGS